MPSKVTADFIIDALEVTWPEIKIKYNPWFITD
jgi:hypothetical protein